MSAIYALSVRYRVGVHAAYTVLWYEGNWAGPGFPSSAALLAAFRTKMEGALLAVLGRGGILHEYAASRQTGSGTDLVLSTVSLSAPALNPPMLPVQVAFPVIVTDPLGTPFEGEYRYWPFPIDTGLSQGEFTGAVSWTTMLALLSQHLVFPSVPPQTFVPQRTSFGLTGAGPAAYAAKLGPYYTQRRRRQDSSFWF